MVATIIPVMAAMYLGNAFNLRTFQKGNADIFSPSTLEGNIETIDRSFTRSQYKLVETSTQAREFLDVSGAISLRVKKGDVNIGGAGDYLREMANRQKFVELLIRVQHETVTETIPSHLKPNAEWMTRPPSQVGTHFVRSITYGGELIASLRLKARNSEERERIKAAVTANLQLSGAFDLNSNGSFDKLRKDLSGAYDEDIKVMATKMPTHIPNSVEKLMLLVEDYPKEINSINEGKGKALKAELYPLASLKADYPLFLPSTAINNILDDVETKYDDIRITMSEIHKWNRERPDTDDDDNDKVDAFFDVLSGAQSAFHIAIGDMDISNAGKASQFDTAFKAYGKGKDNLPNRFQRQFWKLRHEVGKEPIVWKKPHASGTVYTNWGGITCTSKIHGDSKLLQKGYAVSTASTAWSGGRNFICLPEDDPKLGSKITADRKRALLQAVEYRNLNDSTKTSFLRCATCLSKGRLQTRTFPAMTACPKDWNLEYSGYLMADSTSNVDRDFICVNKKMDKVTEEEDQSLSNTAKLNVLWMNCEKCESEKIVPCVVCTN